MSSLLPILIIEEVSVNPSPDSYNVKISDLDASANRSGNGLLFRDRIAVKRTIDVSWTKIDGGTLSVLLNLLKKVFLTVKYIDPEVGGYRTGTFYVSDRSTGVAFREENGDLTWKGASFSLVER